MTVVGDAMVQNSEADLLLPVMQVIEPEHADSSDTDSDHDNVPSDLAATTPAQGKFAARLRSQMRLDTAATPTSAGAPLLTPASSAGVRMGHRGSATGGYVSASLLKVKMQEKKNKLVKQNTISELFCDDRQRELADSIRVHVRELLAKSDHLEEFYDEAFTTGAEAIFDSFPQDLSGLLCGQHLCDAVSKALPSASMGAFCLEDEQLLTDMLHSFALLVHADPHAPWGVSRAIFADFVRFAVAWHVEHKLSTPLLETLRADGERNVDVLLICGPHAARKEFLASTLFRKYRGKIEAPVCTNTREMHDWEEDGMQARFVSEEDFDTLAARQELVAQKEAWYGRVGYTYVSLMEPSMERSKLCVLASLDDSRAAAKLLERARKFRDIRFKTVFCKLPEGVEEPTVEVAGASAEHFAQSPDAWEAEQLREHASPWDLVLSGDLSESASVDALEQFLATELSKKQKAMYQGIKTESVARLSSEHLHEILATNNYTNVQRVMNKDVAALYERAQAQGLTSAFAKAFGKGDLAEVPAADKVKAMAAMCTGGLPRFGDAASFNLFVKQLADRMEIEESWLVAALAHTFTARAQLPEDIVELCFQAAGKSNARDSFTSHDFSQLAHHCGWVPHKMDQGDVTMIYLHVCHHQRARRDGTVARPQLDACGPKTLAEQRAEFEAEGIDVTAFYKANLSTLDDLEFLLEATAARTGKPLLELLTDVKRTAKAEKIKMVAPRCLNKLKMMGCLQGATSEPDLEPKRASTPPGKLPPLSKKKSADAQPEKVVRRALTKRARQTSIDSVASDASTCAPSVRAESPAPLGKSRARSTTPEPFDRPSTSVGVARRSTLRI